MRLVLWAVAILVEPSGILAILSLKAEVIVILRRFFVFNECLLSLWVLLSLKYINQIKNSPPLTTFYSQLIYF